MSKTTTNKVMNVAEALVWMTFVLSSGLGAMMLLNIVRLTDLAKAVVGYALAAFAVLVFGYLAYRAVEKS